MTTESRPAQPVLMRHHAVSGASYTEFRLMFTSRAKHTNTLTPKNNTMSATNNIYTAISDIMNEIGHISKVKRNEQQGFMFRGIDQVMNTLKPLLAKHGVFIVPEVVDAKREERTTARGGNLIYSVLTVKHHFIASDGSEVVSTTIGEGMDSADKASNKAMAIAFKYACFQVFCIPTEELAADDPDNYTVDAVMPRKTTKVDAEFDAYLDHLRSMTTIDELVALWNSTSPDMQRNEIVCTTFADVKRKILQANGTNGNR